MNPKIDWELGTWQYRKLGKIELVSAQKFQREIGNPQLRCIVARTKEERLEPGLRIAAIGAIQPTMLPKEYQDYEDVFDPSAATMLPEHHPMEHKIDLMPNTEPPWGPVYPLSQPELEEL